MNRQIQTWISQGLKRRNIDPSSLTFASNPEFLREGKSIYDTLYPDRIVIGSDNEHALATLKALYAPIINAEFLPPKNIDTKTQQSAHRTHPVEIVATDFVTAEMIKYTANAFLAVKISYINEIAELAECVGADIRTISHGIGLDHRIAKPFLKSGLGWGGSCFPKDTIALMSIAEEYGIDLPIIDAARQINSYQIDRVIQQLQNHLKILRAQKIAILGIAFKAETDDVRNSPAVQLAQKLISLGAHIVMHDPKGLDNARQIYKDTSIDFADNIDDCVSDTVATIIATDWKQYHHLDWAMLRQQMATSIPPYKNSPIVFDARLICDRNAIERVGLQYLSL